MFLKGCRNLGFEILHKSFSDRIIKIAHFKSVNCKLPAEDVIRKIMAFVLNEEATHRSFIDYFGKSPGSHTRKIIKKALRQGK